MHTSWFMAFLFWTAVAFAIGAQLFNFSCIRPEDRTTRRKVALGLGMGAAFLSAFVGWLVAVDWGKLPTSNNGLTAGQLWSNGGIVVVEPR